MQLKWINARLELKEEMAKALMNLAREGIDPCFCYFVKDKSLC